MKKLFAGIGMVVAAWAAQAQAAEVTWQKDIKPLFDKKCAACHGAGAPEQAEFKKDKKKYTEKSVGMKMDTYAHLLSFVGWPDSGALMRRLDDGSNREDKKPGNMFQYLGDTDVERKANLELFKAWVGNWNLKRWKDVTKEEVGALKVTY